MEIVNYINIGERERLEDYVVVESFSETSCAAIVADGMGGYAAGDVAAKLVSDAILSAIGRGQEINTAVSVASLALRKYKEENHLEGTGCTIAGVVVGDGVATVFWAGDARVYLLRNGVIINQTRDHSLVNELSKIRVLTPEQIRKYDHVVRKAIIGDDADMVEVEKWYLSKGDDVVVCSDGLHKEISINQLLEFVKNGRHEDLLGSKVLKDNNSFVYIGV